MVAMRIVLARFLVVAAALVMCCPDTWSDEIKLKDGKKLSGTIVAFEDNMFRVKTDFGFVLVEKDKIASITPSSPASNPAATKAENKPLKKSAAKADVEAARTAAESNPKETKPATESSSSAQPAPLSDRPSKSGVKKRAGTSTVEATANERSSNVPSSSPIVQPAPVPIQKPPINFAPPRPTLSPALARDFGPSAGAAPAIAGKPNAPKNIPVGLASAKSVPPPVNREEIQGNEYINYTHGFRIFKPPSWKLIPDARQALPNAVVAMGTSDESTLMVVAEEKSAESLDITAANVEKKLRDVYGNYRHISQRKTVAGGFPAVEIHYRGLADEHDWSGTILVVAHRDDIFSILGMTYSGSDLIQIQENVIARSLASLEFRTN